MAVRWLHINCCHGSQVKGELREAMPATTARASGSLRATLSRLFTAPLALVRPLRGSHALKTHGRRELRTKCHDIYLEALRRAGVCLAREPSFFARV